MSTPTSPSTAAVDRVMAGLEQARPWMEDLYRHLHAHPELSMVEHGTAARIRDELATLVEEHCGEDRDLSAEIVPDLAVTGTALVLRHGEGPTVLLRADIDGLPVEEDTGLDYASTARQQGKDGVEMPVMHACGHDTHITTLLAALRLLMSAPEAWSGTVVAIFQPAEEQWNGAEAVVADGLVDRLPRPDVGLAQHVLPGPAGSVQIAPGPVMASCDDFRITLHGRGGHGSAPHVAKDPVVMASSLVMRLQAIVSRQVDPQATAVVTVGRISSGTKTNIIPERAVIEGTIRTYDDAVATRCRELVERTARAEAAAWDVPEPAIEFFDHLPVTDNDPDTAATVRESFLNHLGEDAVRVFEPAMGSEDFSELPNAWGVPYVFWGFGAFDAQDWARSEEAGTLDADFPDNHAAQFAPVLQPMLDTGARAMVIAALTWLGRD